jgi:hypothetical protein
MKKVDVNKLQKLMYEIHEVKQIQDRKNEIESWYREDSPNRNLITGLTSHDSYEKHLAKLRDLKNEREKLYSRIEEKSPLALALLLETILCYPDITIRGRITEKKRDSKIITKRDYKDSQTRKALKHYKKAIENIQKAVKRENKKLKEKGHSFYLYPINVTIHNPSNDIESIEHRPQERGVDLIKNLADILFPCFKTQTERAKTIKSILQIIYGVPESNIDQRNIAKYC